MTQRATCHGLTGLRGVAAIVVVIQHCFQTFKVGAVDQPYLPMDWADPWLVLKQGTLAALNGAGAVVLFFVLSGLVLTLSIQRDGDLGPVSLLRYWVRRVFRLFPLLVAVSVLAALLYAMGPAHVDAPYAARWVVEHLAVVPDVQQLARNMMGISNTFNVPAWSITIEIVVSMIFPVLFFLALRGTLATNLAVLLGLSLVALFKPFHFRYVEVFLFAFFLGPVVLLHGQAFGSWLWSLARHWRVAVVAALVVIGIGAERYYSAEWNHAASMLVLSVSAAGLIAAIYHGPWQGFLFDRRVVRLGDISYGIYLIHFPVMMAIARLMMPLVTREPHPAEAMALEMAMTVVVLAITLPLAWLSLRFLEAPMQDWGRAVAARLRIGSGRAPAG